MHPPRLLYPLALLTLTLLLARPAISRGQDVWNTYQDTDPRLRYEHGTWQTFAVAAALGGTLTGTADPGATLTAYFEGTAVQLVYSLGPEGRTFSAQVDDGPLSTVYSYGDGYSHGHTLAFSDLPAGVHVLTVTNGDGAIWIEAVQVRGELLAPPATTAEEKIGSIAEEFPGFTLFFADDFDSGAASEWRNSQTDVNTLLIPHDDGQALRVAGDAWPVHAFVGALGDQVLQMRVLVESGTARLAAKVSDTGAYVIALDQAGTLRLDYGQVTLATAQTTVPPGTWLTLRIAIIGDTVTIWVDGYQALHFATNSTLLPGFFSLLPDGENSAAFQVDDLEVWIPAPTLPVAAVSLASPLTYVPEDLGLGTTSRMAHVGGSTLHVNNVPVTDWSSLAGPEWSPDGHQIVMLLSTSLTLRILNADGTRQRDIRVRITDVPYPDRPDYLLDPAWSPDGTKIAFRMVSTQGVNRIYYLDADCAQELCDATRLTNGMTSESYPTWSPDSTSLAYCTSWVVWDGQHFVTLSTIRMVTLTNPNPVELVVPSTDYYRDLDWAPDANWLALSLRRATDLKYVIARLDMASGTMTQYTDPVSPYGDYDPTVSPDGTMIAFQRASSPEWYSDLYVVPADAPLTEAPVSQYTNLRSPDWGIMPSSQVEVIFGVEAIYHIVGGALVEDAFSKPTPHSVVEFSVQVTNRGSTPIEHGQLRLRLLPDDEFPAPDEDTPTMWYFSGGRLSGIDPEFPLQVRYGNDINLQPGETQTIQVFGGPLRLIPTLQGNNSLAFKFVTGSDDATAEVLTVQTVDVIEAVLTHIDFECSDPACPYKDPAPDPAWPPSVGGWKAAMFWVIYHEYSNGTILSNDWYGIPQDSNGQPVTTCFQTGPEAGFQSVNVVRIVHQQSPGDPPIADEELFCRDYRYLAAQTMINGYLNSERRSGLNNAFAYMATNFRRSLGNDFSDCVSNPTNPGCNMLHEDTEGNRIWAHRGCFLDGRTYKQARGLGDSVYTLQWIDHYTSCYLKDMRTQADDAWDNHFVDLYDELLGDSGVITWAVRDLQSYCTIEPGNLDSYDPRNPEQYKRCDPTDGAFSLLKATHPTIALDTEVAVNGVIETGQTIEDLINGPWTEAIQNAYLLHIEKLTQGAGEGYRPNFPSIVQPVLWPQHNKDNFNYIQKVFWTTVSYQQTGELLHKPR